MIINLYRRKRERGGKNPCERKRARKVCKSCETSHCGFLSRQKHQCHRNLVICICYAQPKCLYQFDHEQGVLLLLKLFSFFPPSPFLWDEKIVIIKGTRPSAFLLIDQADLDGKGYSTLDDSGIQLNKSFLSLSLPTGCDR